MMSRCTIGLVLAVIVAGPLAGCSLKGGDAPRKAQVTPPPTNDLYKRLGEQKLRAVVDDMVDLAAKDPKVAMDRAGKAAGWSATPQNIADFKRGLFEFVAAATGGPQIYRGKDMVTAHRGMNITSEQFDAMINHLKTAMNKNQVPSDAQQDLTQVFNGTRGAIVQLPKSASQ
jgi:hemoglobin